MTATTTANNDNNKNNTTVVDLEGQIVKIRTISKRLAFCDLRLLGIDGGVGGLGGGGSSSSEEREEETIEVVVKPFAWTPPTTCKEVLRPITLGSTVKIKGFWEGTTDDENNNNNGIRKHRILQCTAPPIVVRLWSGDPFEGKLTYCPPVIGNKEKPASSSSNSSNLLCKYYTNTRQCPRLPHCPYVHTDDKELRRQYFRNKKLAALETERDVVTTAGGEEASSLLSSPLYLSHLKPKSHRAAIFCEFLVQEFGLQPQGKPTNDLVLDVAGGRGDLCFQLSALRGIPCTTVDPRGRKLNKEQRKYLKKQHNQRQQQGDQPNDDANSSIKESKQRNAAYWGEHISQWFDSSFLDDDNSDDNDNDNDNRYHQKQQHPDLRSRITLIAGLHPDQATEHIVDCALKHNLSFAIAPCCVFPTTKAGKTTLTFQEWCQHLKQKHKDIQQTYMNVQGKNLILYYKSTRPIESNDDLK